MANQIIILPLCALYGIVLLQGIVLLCRGRGDEGRKEVRLPVIMFWIGTLGGAVLLAFDIASAIQDGSLGLTICFSLLALVGISLMVAYLNCCITFDRHGLTHKNFWGICRSYTYDQLTAWEINSGNPGESYLYVGKKKLSFNLLHENGADFVDAFLRGYRKAHHGAELPNMRKILRAGKGFRAHVHNPGEFLFIFIMMLVFVIGMGIWCVVTVLEPVTEEDGELMELTFTSWEVEEDDLRLISPDKAEAFLIGGYEEHLSHCGSLQENCNGSTAFSVRASRITPDKGEPYYNVLSIAAGDEVYRTLEDSTAYSREDLYPTILFWGGFLVLVLAFAALTYAVGSNPQKFPKWLVYGVFKKDAIDI